MNITLAGRDGLTLTVSQCSVTIARDGAERVELWSRAEELWARVGSLVDGDSCDIVAGARFALDLLRNA